MDAVKIHIQYSVHDRKEIKRNNYFMDIVKIDVQTIIGLKKIQKTNETMSF